MFTETLYFVSCNQAGYILFHFRHKFRIQRQTKFIEYFGNTVTDKLEHLYAETVEHFGDNCFLSVQQRHLKYLSEKLLDIYIFSSTLRNAKYRLIDSIEDANNFHGLLLQHNKAVNLDYLNMTLDDDDAVLTSCTWVFKGLYDIAQSYGDLLF